MRRAVIVVCSSAPASAVQARHDRARGDRVRARSRPAAASATSVWAVVAAVAVLVVASVPFGVHDVWNQSVRYHLDTGEKQERVGQPAQDVEHAR